MLCTVAIATWNRADALRKSLEAMCSLRVPNGVEWELVVVNNNCTDDTDEAVMSFAGRLPVRLLHEGTPGKSLACNLAIREAKGECLLWTDDDALVEPDWLSRLLHGLKEYRADFVFGRSKPLWPGSRPGWYDERFAGYFAILDYGPEPFLVTNRQQSFYGLNYGGRLEAFRELGGFRAQFGFRGKLGGVGEDTDLFERAYDRGMRITYLPDAIVHHMIPASRIEKPYHRQRHWAANEVYYEVLPELYPEVPWMLGLPRFMFAKATADTFGLARAIVKRAAPDQFHHEMQLVRFCRLLLEAARHGFRTPSGARRAVTSQETE